MENQKKLYTPIFALDFFIIVAFLILHKRAVHTRYTVFKEHAGF